MKPEIRLAVTDAARVQIVRGRRVLHSIKIGPNKVHAAIIHKNGEFEDLGISENLLITSSAGGRDLIAAGLGGLLPAGGQGSPATASSATTLTATGTPWTTNLLAGMRVVVPITNLTTAPVYGNIISNTTSVITVDQWWTGADVAGTTPAATSAFIILPGAAPARFMALTQDTGAPNAADTALTGEITTGGCARALAAYAHTLAAGTYTLQKAFAVTATFAAIHKMGIFHSGTGTAGVMLYESLLNADASVVNGDTLTITETVTLS